MIHVLIDSSILAQDPTRRKASTNTLVLLCKAKVIQWHLPDMVRREILTQLQMSVRNSKSDIKQSIKGYNSLPLSQSQKTRINQIKDDIEQFAKVIENSLESDFDAFLQSTFTIIHKIMPDHGQIVMDRYFSGAPPFKSIKNRNDIPDSFIFQTIVELVTKLPKLNVIVNDGALRSACKTISNVEAFSSLEAFIESKEVSDLVKQTEKQKQIEVLGSRFPDYSSLIKSKLEEQLFDNMSNLTVEDESILDDNHEASIYALTSVDNVDLLFTEMKYYGNRQFVLPFHIEATADLCYYIFKSEYYALSEERAMSISIEDHNNHYFQAIENASIEIKGFLNLITPIEFENDTDFYQDTEIKIDRVEGIELNQSLDQY